MKSQFFTRVLVTVAVALSGLSLSVVSTDADAKRLGGGRPAGMQRQMPAQQGYGSTPAKPATPNVAPGQNAANPAQAAPGMAAAAQPAKRSWMGPLAGLAAGLGIAALASHFGLGGALANVMTMVLVGVVLMVAVGWLMRRMRGAGAGTGFNGPQLAGAGAPMGNVTPMSREVFGSPQPSLAQTGLSAAPAAAAASMTLPDGFDAEGFTRVAKMIFIRLQAANDACNVEDLRKFTTPELFASLRLDLQERGGVAQQTDVVQLDADLVDTAREEAQWVATVRFKGLIREEAAQGAQPFDELWHLVRPLSGQSEWVIAGITPQAV